MSAFCTVADIAEFLQTDIAPANAAALRAITEASAVIQNYCHQQLEAVQGDEEMFLFSRGSRLFLPQLPVTEVSVVEVGVELVEGADYLLDRYGVLHRVGGNWSAGVIRVTYSHGYQTLPDDIVAVATRAAARAYQSGRRAAETAAVPGVSATSLGDYSVTYSAEGGGSDGILGASAAPMLLRSEKEILDRYRQVR